MAINQKEITTVLNLNQKTCSKLETVVFEYASLVQKMNELNYYLENRETLIKLLGW